MKLVINALLIVVVASCYKNEETQQVPEGAPWKSQTIKYELPPEGYTAVTIWGNAATLTSDQSAGLEAIFYIDSWKVIEHDNGIETIIYQDYFDEPVVHTLTKDEGGLFCRFPTWFDSTCNNNYDHPNNMVIKDGNLIIDVSDEPGKISHWWTPRKLCSETAYYSIELSIKVVGQVAVQFGLDYWRNLNIQHNNIYDPQCIESNNCEAWITDWINDTGGEYITLRLPKR